MKYFSAIVVLLAVTLLSCKKPDKRDLLPKTQTTVFVTATPAYILVRYVASTYDLQRGPSPAKYDFQFGKVLIHTECWYVETVSCTAIPDPRLPVGVPLNIERTEQEFLEFREFPNDTRVIRFKVLSEEAQ